MPIRLYKKHLKACQHLLQSLLGIAIEHKSHTHAGIVDYYVDIVNK